MKAHHGTYRFIFDTFTPPLSKIRHSLVIYFVRIKAPRHPVVIYLIIYHSKSIADAVAPNFIIVGFEEIKGF